MSVWNDRRADPDKESAARSAVVFAGNSERADLIVGADQEASCSLKIFGRICSMVVESGAAQFVLGTICE